jgi:hypothetical protein
MGRVVASCVPLPAPRSRTGARCTRSVRRRRELLNHWQRVAKLILAKEDVLTVSRALELALFMDAKLDVSQL